MLKSKSKSKRNSKFSKKSSKGKAATAHQKLSKKEQKQQQKAKKKQADRDRREFLKILTPTGLFAGLIGVLLFVANKAKLGVAAGGGLLTLILSYKYPRQALWAFLIYLPISGTVTYWVGGGSAIFHFVKDAFYFPALLAFFQELKRCRLPFIIPKGMIQPLMILLTVCSLTFLLVNGAQQFSANPGGKPILMGILGLKVLLGYIPLILCSYYLIRNQREFFFFTRLQVILILICCGLGLLQYFLLVKGICVGTRNYEGADLFKATTEAKCIVGGSLAYSPQVNMIRLPGTFVAPWQWAWFLISSIFFTFGSAFSDPSFRWRMTGFAGMALVCINAIVCGQRAAMILIPLAIAILLFITGQITNFKRFIPIATLFTIGSILGVTIYRDFIEQRIESLVSRWEASPFTEFFVEQWTFTSNAQVGLLGKGLGRGTNSARILGDTTLIETWFPKLIYEIGPVGLIGFLIFVTALTFLTFKAYRSIKESHLRSFAACFWVFILFISYNPYWYPLDTDPVCAYYWFLAGAIFKLPEIERQEEEKTKELESEPLLDKKKLRLRKTPRSSIV